MAFQHIKWSFFIEKKIKKIHIDQSTALQMVAILDFWGVTATPLS